MKRERNICNYMRFAQKREREKKTAFNKLTSPVDVMFLQSFNLTLSERLAICGGISQSRSSISEAQRDS